MTGFTSISSIIVTLTLLLPLGSAIPDGIHNNDCNLNTNKTQHFSYR